MSLLKALKRHWLLATTLGLIAATAASAAAWYLMPVRYFGETTLKITSIKLVQVDNEGASPFSPQTRSASTAAYPGAASGQQVQKAPAQAQQQTSQGPGLFGQMASTAA